MVRLIVLFIVAFLLWVGLRALLGRKNLTVNQFAAIYLASLVGIAFLYLGLTGKLHPLFAFLGAALPFMTRLISIAMRGAQIAAFMKFLRNMGIGTSWGGSTSGARAPNTSEISSRYIHMVLHHDTGRMEGEVLEGSFRDTSLSAMNLDQLKQLYGEIQQDSDSVNLLMAYLDREHPDWQNDEEKSARQPSLSDDMSEAQALDILGLDEDAGYEDIVRAHRSLMQRVHPDRGGSSFLAARINQAKDILLSGH